MSEVIASSEIDAAQAALLDEIKELRHRLLPKFLLVLAASFVIWLLWSCWLSENLSSLEVAWVVIAAVGLVAGKLSAYHYRCSTWVLLLGVTVGLALLQLGTPSPVIMAMGTLTIIVAGSLLSFVEVLLMGLLAYAALVGIWFRVAPGVIPAAVAQGWAAFYLLVVVATQIGQSPMREAAHLALEGWVQLRNALLQARERRGELHRVAHALEEATYRIERMNNELTLARYQAELAFANKARFAATVSHELRGPLNLILGFARLMALSPERYGAPLPREYRADVDTIYASSRHLVALLDDVLDLSQAEVERMPLVKEWVDLSDVLAEAEAVVRPLAERKGLRLRSDHEGQSIIVLADRVRLRQVMLNLLTNAVRFTEQGEVRVASDEQPDHVVVSVHDTGRGIRHEDLPRLFQEFSQVHSEQEPGQSSGLGLAISRHLVQLHGGRIWAESEEGVGTTVSFSVPLTDRPPTVVRRIRALPGQAPLQRDLVLVAHRNAAVVRFLARHLQDYQVVGSPGVANLPTLVHNHMPRAVIVDADLSGSVAEALDRAGLRVPLVACSMPSLADRPQDERPSSYLIKPVTQEMLEATLHEVVPTGEELTVLIVDDDPDAVRLLEIMLRQGSLPRRVLKANDGQRALAIMATTRPDLVLMDLVMPDLDGNATLARMRMDPRLRDVPVVVISARDATDDMASLGSYLEVRTPQPVATGEAVKRLRAVLQTLSPAYLPAVTALEPRLEARSG